MLEIDIVDNVLKNIFGNWPWHDNNALVVFLLMYIVHVCFYGISIEYFFRIDLRDERLVGCNIESADSTKVSASS